MNEHLYILDSIGCETWAFWTTGIAALGHDRIDVPSR